MILKIKKYIWRNKDGEKRIILKTYKKDYSEKEIGGIQLEKSSLTPFQK